MFGFATVSAPFNNSQTECVDSLSSADILQGKGGNQHKDFKKVNKYRLNVKHQVKCMGRGGIFATILQNKNDTFRQYTSREHISQWRTCTIFSLKCFITLFLLSVAGMKTLNSSPNLTLQPVAPNQSVPRCFREADGSS